MRVERYIKAEGRPWKIVMPGYKNVSRIDCLSEDLIKYFNSIMSPEPDEKKVYPCFDCMDVGYIDVVHAYKKNVVGDISLPSYYRWIILPFENMPSLEKVLENAKEMVKTKNDEE